MDQKYQPFRGKVVVERTTLLFERFIRLISAKVRFELFDVSAMADPDFEYLIMESVDTVAAVVHDTASGTVTLVEQFRFATHKKTGGWLLEIPAGTLEEGESPKDGVIREIFEETGYRVSDVTPIGEFYIAPGGSDERVFLFYAPVTQKDKVAKGSGLAHEGEYIRTVAIPLETAFDMLERNEFDDAKTIIGLQWLRHHFGQGHL